MACMPCSMLGHTALGACLLLLATLGHTPYVQPSPGQRGGGVTLNLRRGVGFSDCGGDGGSGFISR